MYVELYVHNNTQEAVSFDWDCCVEYIRKLNKQLCLFLLATVRLYWITFSISLYQSDSVATKILQKIEKEKAESESKSHWEKTLLDFVKHETQLLDVKAYSDLCHLFDDRNLSAQDIAT